MWTINVVLLFHIILYAQNSLVFVPKNMGVQNSGKDIGKGRVGGESQGMEESTEVWAFMQFSHRCLAVGFLIVLLFLEASS